MTLPNFFIVGAQKAGTTSLYRYLQQHPQIYFSSKKEPHYFIWSDKDVEFLFPFGVIETKNYISRLDEYENLFAKAGDARAIGEASTHYLVHPSVPEKINTAVPDAKVIAILRDPIERGYSAYKYNRMLGLEDIDSFQRALKEEPSRIAENWGYGWRYGSYGQYYDHVKRYINEFGRENILIIIYDDFIEDPIQVCKNVFSFLDVDSSFIPNVTAKYNVTIESDRNVRFLIHRFLQNESQIRKWIRFVARKILSDEMRFKLIESITYGPSKNQPPTSKLTENERHELIQFFKDDIVKLEKLINRDLSIWYRC